MYVPEAFALTKLSDQHDVIDAHDFGLLISNGVDGFCGTHIPMTLQRTEGSKGTLYGHVARANPHMKLFGSTAMAVFSGPHGYVSPRWYSERATNVPTWNYVAVHCYGIVKALNDDPLEMLRELSDRFEANASDRWSIDELKPQIRATLPRGIVAFRMEIERIEGKAKLSQNKARQERERVIEGLSAAGEIALASAMKRELDKG